MWRALGMIVTRLQQRQIFQAEWAREQRLLSALSTRKYLLSDIMDQNRQLMDSHVVLGFSRCGQLLFSYRSELNVTATHSTYTLYCWRFLGNSPLRYVCKEPLFRGESVPAELHLLVCQTPPPTHTVVVGCRRSCTEDFHRPCFVSILPSLPPSTTHPHHYSLHFKFDLMPPFPSFIPSLSLRIPNCVILNTGDSVIALRYSLPPTHSNLSLQYLSSGYSTQLVQRFASGSDPLHTTSSPNQDIEPHTSDNSFAGTSGSPSHLLPVDVYLGNHIMPDTFQSEKGTTCVSVSQVSLDVELWLNKALQSELASRAITYHSLTDYDLQLTEVCAGGGSVVLILVVLLEASPISSTSLYSYSLEVMASWNTHTGAIDLCHISTLKQAQPPAFVAGVRQWNPAAPIALSYRHRYTVPMAAAGAVRAFSNHTVFSGKSLRCLQHTFLPISLTLTPVTPTS